jgi:hypothetical protein
MIKGFFGHGDSLEDERNKGGILEHARLLNRRSLLVDGVLHKLRGPARGPIPPVDEVGGGIDEEPTYIHFRDLVTALGGKYKYNPVTEVVEVTMPKTRHSHRPRHRTTEQPVRTLR